MEQKFNIFIPVDIIEKGKRGEDGLPEELHIAGVASMTPSDQSKRDLDGEWLDVNGFDYKPFLQKGFFNLEHKGREDYANIIGEPISAAVKDGKFYVEGKLYKENPKAVSVWQLGQILKKAGSTRKIGFSIEGKAKERDPYDPKKVTKATVTGVAVTISPKNDGTECLFKGEVDYEKQPGSELLIDITDKDGVRWTVDKDLNIEKGGPGSRGGKIIGYTKSGKPIYDSAKKGESSGNKRIRDEKIQDELDSIIEGAGWATDDYIMNFSEGLTKKEKYHLMYRLAQKGLLYNEEDLSEDEATGSAIPGKKAKMTTKDVDFIYGKLNKATVAADITGTDTTDNNLTQQPLKKESVEGKKKKKKPVLKDQMSKAEVLTMLSSELNLDAESCKNVWGLIERIEKKNRR